VREDQKAYLAEMEARRKQAVASVLVQPASSKDVLTEKQRARTKEVQAMLERGDNPFTHEELEKNNKVSTIGSTSFVKKEHDRTAELEAKWAARHEPSGDDIILLDDVGIDLNCVARPQFRTINNPDGTVTEVPILYCTFCGNEVPETRATHGRGAPLIIKTEEPEWNGEAWINVKTMKIISNKSIACPDCCLNLLPYYKKCIPCKGKGYIDDVQCSACKGTGHGELVNQIQFPAMEG
jgi:hypothetical protein